MSNPISTSDSKTEYKNGDVINYDNGVMHGIGRIRGIAQTGEACIGRTFIVEDLSGNIPNETYPFSYFAMFECHITTKPDTQELNDAFAAIESHDINKPHSYKATLGYCPVCGAPGTLRERRINGDDICANGHRYPSKKCN